jgi:hypothetical protein
MVQSSSWGLKQLMAREKTITKTKQEKTTPQLSL